MTWRRLAAAFSGCITTQVTILFWSLRNDFYRPYNGSPPSVSLTTPGLSAATAGLATDSFFSVSFLEQIIDFVWKTIQWPPEKHNSLPFLQATQRSQTLKGLFELTRHPSKVPSPQPLLMSCFRNPVPELSAINPTAILEKLYPHCLRYTRTPSRVEVPGHRQKQQTQTLIVCSKTTLLNLDPWL